MEYFLKNGNIETKSDIRLFTLFAFLNSFGNYNLELNEQMSESRKELIDDLGKVFSNIDQNIINKWQNFYKEHPAHNCLYIRYVLALSVSSGFRIIKDSNEIQKEGLLEYLEGFNKILSDFYTTCNIKELYESKFKSYRCHLKDF